MPPMSTDALGQLDVLIVDDDSALLRTLTDILRLRGYRARTATSGREGIEVASHLGDPPLIALVDLRLPDMDGMELVAMLRAASRQTEVVILTGNATVDSAIRALREQSFDYLLKPVEPETLFKTLEKAAERRSRRIAETALQQSEEQLRRLFDAVADGVLVTGPDGVAQRCNRAGLEILRRVESAVLGRPLRDLLPTAPAADQAPAEATDSPREVALRFDDGVERLVEVRSTGFSADRHVHMLRDITEQRKLEERVRHSDRIEAVGRLAGGVAHDFNNILTAIDGYVSMLLADDPTPSTREAATEIQLAASRAANLTRQLLAFSRRQVVQLRNFDLVALARGMESMLRRLVREDIEFRTRYEDDGATVRADPAQIEQIVMNLVVNARDAMSKGGVLSLAVVARDVAPGEIRGLRAPLPPGRYVEVAVTDTGHGIDAETLQHIFEPFFTTKRAGAGTGLGLASTLAVVQKLQGEVVVESRVGEGTTFRVFLPHVDAEAEPEAATPSNRRSLAGAGERVMIVEDDAGVRSIAARILRNAGYEVTTAARGSEALAHIDVTPDSLPAVVLTDVVMPEMTGLELARRLVARNSDLRVLFMSGYPDDVIEAADLASPATAYLQKPFSTPELLAAVRAILDAPAGDAAD